MKKLISIVLSFALSAASAPPLFAQYAAPRVASATTHPNELRSLLRVWNMTMEEFTALPDDQKVKLIKGLGFLEAGRRMRIEQLKVVAKSNWLNYMTPEGRITPEGEKLIDEAQANKMDEIANLNMEQLGVNSAKVAEISGLLHNGVGAVELSGKANAMFDGGTPSKPRMVGEVATGAVGAAGTGYLFGALAAKDQALAFAGQALASKAAAESLAMQAGMAARIGDFANAGQLAGQAKAAGGQAMAFKEQALQAAEKAHHLANVAKILTTISGGVAIVDGVWDIYKGVDAKIDVENKTAIDQSFLAAINAVSEGVFIDVGSRIASAYFAMLGITASPEQTAIIGQAFNDVAYAMPADLAVEAAAIIRQALAQLEIQGRKADERIIIGGVKVTAGAAIVIAALLLNPITGPWVAAGGSVVYLAATVYQNRAALAEAWDAFVNMFSAGDKAAIAEAVSPN